MSNLYELNQNYYNLLEVLEEYEDNECVKEVIENSLSQIEGDIKTKIDNLVRFIRNLESDISALKEEEKRLAQKRKTIENNKARLERYLFDFASNSEGKRVKGQLFEISIKKNPAKIIIEDETYIPNEFKTTETIVNIDKAELKKYLKTNDVRGCRLEQGESLKIK